MICLLKMDSAKEVETAMEEASVVGIREPEVAVVLVVPPVLHPVQPSLGAFVLAPAVRRVGLQARVIEANVAFAGRVGFDVCAALAGSLPWKLLGEAVFWGAAFPERAAEHGRVLDTLYHQDGPAHISMKWRDLSLSDVVACAAEVPAFVSDIAERVLRSAPRIVGFSSMGQQTLASIAIAREIKQRRPDVLTVLGGSNPTEPAATGILATTDAFDYVFSGEADLVFPEFCRAYVHEGKHPLQRVVACAPIKDLDVIPMPEYEAYFTEIEPFRESHPFAAAAPYSLLFESSRGCWWGDKHLCTFCGYVTPGTRYRTKSPEKIVDTIVNMADRYGIRHLRASDAIMPSDYTRTVLPLLIERGVECTLAYEIKANQKDTDLDMFIRAGLVEAQPGIESLSSHVLTLMSKGITALENVRLLRDARSRDLHIIWNFITAFPGETREDYEAMIGLIPLIEHLDAPVRWGPIHISRYSPYHTDPSRYGIRNVRAWPVYHHLFGRSAELIAHNFDADYESMWDHPELVARFDAVAGRWAESWRGTVTPPCLEARSTADGGRVVYDQRAVAKTRSYRLSRSESDALDAVRSPVLASAIADCHRGALETLVDLAFVVFYEDRYLSLVTEPEIGERLRSERQEGLARAGRGDSGIGREVSDRVRDFALSAPVDPTRC
jgi:ribosomal peptide maturation radical SAM protein 1